MVDSKLIKWMREHAIKGYSKEYLLKYVTGKGYSVEAVNEALKVVFPEEDVSEEQTKETEEGEQENEIKTEPVTDVIEEESVKVQPELVKSDKPDYLTISLLVGGVLIILILGVFFFIQSITTETVNSEINTSENVSSDVEPPAENLTIGNNETVGVNDTGSNFTTNTTFNDSELDNSTLFNITDNSSE